jgi:hypothetical protein
MGVAVMTRTSGAGALEDAKLVLLVDDGEAEVFHAGALIEQGMGADEDLRLGGERGAARAGLAEEGVLPGAVIEEGHGGIDAARAGAQGDIEAERGEPAFAIEVMLLGENLRRRHERGLRARFDAEEHRGKGDECLARADVAVQQAIHRTRGGEIGADFRDGALLRAGEREGKAGVEALHQRAGAAVIAAGARDVLRAFWSRRARAAGDHGARRDRAIRARDAWRCGTCVA